MVKVIATQPGYFGKALRADGERFEIPDEIWEDEKRRPSWVRLAREAAPEIAPPETAGGEHPPESAPVPSAPVPSAQEPKGNGVKDALGVAPDWVKPETPAK
jgi:hypothetical protein